MKTKRTILLFSSLLLLVACKSQQPIVNVARNDSIVTRHHYHRDSIYLRDSIFIHQKGDTIYCDRWHDRWQVERIQRTDTLYRDRETVVTLPPERYIPPWAWYTLAACILVAVILIIRIILRFYLRR